jgi:hypothetical protein
MSGSPEPSERRVVRFILSEYKSNVDVQGYKEVHSHRITELLASHLRFASHCRPKSRVQWAISHIGNIQ